MAMGKLVLRHGGVLFCRFSPMVLGEKGLCMSNVQQRCGVESLSGAALTDCSTDRELSQV